MTTETRNVKIATKGDIVCEVRIRDGRIHMYFPLSDNFLQVPPRTALRIAYLLVKTTVQYWLGYR